MMPLLNQYRTVLTYEFYDIDCVLKRYCNSITINDTHGNIVAITTQCKDFVSIADELMMSFESFYKNYFPECTTDVDSIIYKIMLGDMALA